MPADADGDGVPDTEDEWPTDPTRTHDMDGDGIADEFDAFPADPTQSQDTDNDGVGDSFDTAPTDPDNGQDNGSGNESDNTSTGGGQCSAPPVSSGDAIAAQIAFQTWSMRCAVERLKEQELVDNKAILDELKLKGAIVTGDVSNCAAAYSCTGSSLECSKVNLLRTQICATSTMDNVGDENANGIADVLETGITEPDALDPESVKFRGAGASGSWDSEIDTNGFLGGGSCPGLPPLFGTTQLSEIACSQGEILQAMIRIFGLFFAAMIVGKSVSGG